LPITVEVFSRGATISSPQANSDTAVWRAPFNCVATNVRGFQNPGTGTTFNARPNLTSYLLASNGTINPALTWVDGGAVQNATFAPGNTLFVSIGVVAGSPTYVAIQVDFIRLPT
jgi:hypothetical protein